jgi:hypothetical protein
MGLGAREVVVFFASPAICGSEDGSSGASGEEMGRLVGGANGRCWWSPWGYRQCEIMGWGRRGCRLRARWRRRQSWKGGACRGGERRSTSSIPTPLSNSTLQRLFVAFLVRFASGGEGVGKDSGGSDWGGGSSAGGGSGWIRGARSGDCTAALTT